MMLTWARTTENSQKERLHPIFEKQPFTPSTKTRGVVFVHSLLFCTLPLTWYAVDDEAIRGLDVYPVTSFKARRAIWQELARLLPTYNPTPSTLTTYCWQHRWQSESNKFERNSSGLSLKICSVHPSPTHYILSHPLMLTEQMRGLSSLSHHYKKVGERIQG